MCCKFGMALQSPSGSRMSSVSKFRSMFIMVKLLSLHRMQPKQWLVQVDSAHQQHAWRSTSVTCLPLAQTAQTRQLYIYTTAQLQPTTRVHLAMRSATHLVKRVMVVGSSSTSQPTNDTVSRAARLPNSADTSEEYTREPASSGTLRLEGIPCSQLQSTGS